MNHMATIYLHCHDAAHFQHIESNFLTSSFRDAPSTFIGIPQHDLLIDPQRVVELSARYTTRAAGLMFDSVSDGFQFVFCEDGKLMRHLQYGGKEHGLWQVAEGEPQPWEEGLFADSPLGNLAEDDPDRALVAGLYQQRQIMAGNRWPAIDARETARAVAVFYRLSGWLDDWDNAGVSDGRPWWKVW